MDKTKIVEKLKKIPYFTIGVVVLVLLFGILIGQSVFNSTQAKPPMPAQINFYGEYKIGNGEWKTLDKEEHIPSTKGDVTLKGKFYYCDPDTGEVYEPIGEGAVIAFYFNHIGAKLTTSDGEEIVFDSENPHIGQSACGKMCIGYTFSGNQDTIVTITLTNPHSFGNETSIDEFINSLAIYNGADYELEQVNKGLTDRTIGLVFIISAFIILGISAFFAAFRIQYTKTMFLIGFMTLFAGVHYLFSSKGAHYWSHMVALNTVFLQISAMLFMSFVNLLSCALLSDKLKKAGNLVIALTVLLSIGCVLVSLIGKVYFYNTWFAYMVGQTIICLITSVLLVLDLKNSSKTIIIVKCAGVMLFVTFIVDFIATCFGWWQGSNATKMWFIIIFIISMISVLRIIPQNVTAALKAKEMIAEQQALKLELQKSRLSLMLSQIKPHFIYNTLGTIGEFCEEKPQKAKQLVNEFALYLRGSFSELDNINLIPVMQELEHVKHYVKIENVRFPDMVITFELQAKEFLIPALSVQPLVENAIKHGLLKLEKGGVVAIKSYETEDAYCISVIDNGVGFDTSAPIDEKKHIGIRNIRDRLKLTCNGELTITSEIGVGTTAIITIPKEKKDESDNG